MRAVIIDPWNQTVYATDKPTWGLDDMFRHLRESFHRLVKDNTETINE